MKKILFILMSFLTFNITLNATSKTVLSQLFKEQNDLVIFTDRVYHNYYDGENSVKEIKEEFLDKLKGNCLESNNVVSCMIKEEYFEKLNEKGFKNITFSKQNKNEDKISINKKTEYEIMTKNDKVLEFKLENITKNTLKMLKKELNETVYEKIILDLSDNTGTSLNQLVTLFSYFIKDDKKNIIQWKEYVGKDKLDIFYKRVIEEDMRTYYKNITIKINETSGAGILMFAYMMKKDYESKVIYTENKEKKRQTTCFLKNVNPIFESDEAYYFTTYPVGAYVDENNNSLSDKTWLELDKMIVKK